MFDEEAYFRYKAFWNDFFEALFRVRANMATDEERDAFDNALEDVSEAEYSAG